MLPLWVGDYLKDTRDLTQAEHGAYLLLLMSAWNLPDGALPDSNAQLARLVCCHHHTWAKQRPKILERFFRQLPDGRWVNGRLLEERSKALEIRQRRSDAAKAARATPAQLDPPKARTVTGVVKMPNSLFDNESAGANAVLSSTSTSKERTDSSPPAPAGKPAKVRSEPEGFAEFYLAYPKKVGRGDAAKAYRAARRRASHAEIMEGLDAAQTTWMLMKTTKQYTPNPAKWLRAECWADERPEIASARKRDETSKLTGQAYLANALAGLV
jgi:uncharacterized protein YdaU (DUF1376 family)